MQATTWDAATHTLRVTPAQFRNMQPILADATLSNADRNTALLRAGGMSEDLAFLALVYSGCTGEPVTIAVRERTAA